VRIDQVEHNDKITLKIFEQLRLADIVVADLTDEKPNCYYELGYSHALNKNVIHTISKKSSIHFDVKDWNFIIYNSIGELKDGLRRRIEATVIDDAELARRAAKRGLFWFSLKYT
jgi:nucleoside 2-deoxyribosyltransferase